MITHGSTFSGIGAPEVAAEMLGWQNAFHCEINPFGREVLDYYFPNAESYEDITKQDFSKWRGKITVLTGGFPCQPFSYAGKRRGSEDDRYLWPFMLRCIDQIRPTWFVGENVAGITTMVFPGEDVKVGEGGTLFDTQDYMERTEPYVIEAICQQLEDIGYSVQPMLIPACAVGAPHRRDRVFFIAHRNSEVDGSERRDVANTQSQQGDGLRPEQSETRKPKPCQLGGGDCEDGGEFSHAKDTIHSGLMGREHDEQGSERNIGDTCPGGAEWLRSKEGVRYLLPTERWRTFPTVSPVYRGNDGLPFDVDHLTIPFSRWKKESLKAYGNAIVVQVMYEIFRMIDEIEKNK